MKTIARPAKSPAIPELASAIFDTGRRGNPKPGCDCVQCFGYCLTDPDVALRHRLEASRPIDDAFLEVFA